ncbi:hypothetical protein KPH14_007429 [Odynerus spinipes]|uniref:Uncharacterized protein n=1 Tax=Odynerus spinipes TaxID=1348599 RepID=A0AAD9VIQ6_9HYME|nr:hypothetical protein KPH14_007429 [Odynerus spinipes]
MDPGQRARSGNGGELWSFSRGQERVWRGRKWRDEVLPYYESRWTLMRAESPSRRSTGSGSNGNSSCDSAPGSGSSRHRLARLSSGSRRHPRERRRR